MSSTTVISYRTRWSPILLREQALPAELQPTELLIVVSYIALNALDMKLRSIVGFFPSAHEAGKEFSGTVAKAGSAVAAQFVPGDRVCGALVSVFEGTMGTKAVVDVSKQAVLKTPAGLSDAEAAAFPVAFGTAFSLLERTPQRGSLLVLGGATTVGTYALQLAKDYFKFDTVVATCSSYSSPFVSSLGADKTINYKVRNVSAELKKLGIRFDAIVDTVGGYDALRVWPSILKSYADGGVYATCGGDHAPAGRYSTSALGPTLRSLPWMVPRLLLGKWLGINYQFVSVAAGAWTKAAPDFVTRDDVKIVIDSVHPLADVQRAWDKVDRIAARGKVLLATKAAA